MFNCHVTCSQVYDAVNQEGMKADLKKSLANRSQNITHITLRWKCISNSQRAAARPWQHTCFEVVDSYCQLNKNPVSVELTVCVLAKGKNTPLCRLLKNSVAVWEFFLSYLVKIKLLSSVLRFAIKHWSRLDIIYTHFLIASVEQLSLFSNLVNRSHLVTDQASVQVQASNNTNINIMPLLFICQAFCVYTSTIRFLVPNVLLLDIEQKSAIAVQTALTNLLYKCSDRRILNFGLCQECNTHAWSRSHSSSETPCLLPLWLWLIFSY